MDMGMATGMGMAIELLDALSAAAPMDGDCR